MLSNVDDPKAKRGHKSFFKAWAQRAMSWVPRSDGPCNAGTILNFPRTCSVKLALNVHSIKSQINMKSQS